jgi:hypothetical protein
MSVDELVGRVKAAEERYGLKGNGGSSGTRLNFTEEELVEKVVSRLQVSGGSGSGGGSNAASTQRRGHGGGAS